MTPIDYPAAPSVRASLASAGLMAAACLGILAGCGAGDEAGRIPAEAAPITEAATDGSSVNEPWTPTEGPPIVEGADSLGVLEVVQPENAERPLYKEFGDVAYGTNLFWNTTMKNTGTEPVIIRSAQAACGCTRFMDFRVTDAEGNGPDRPTPFAASKDRSLASIPPGGQIQMRMKLMTALSKVNQRKLAMMRLFTNSQLEPYMTFEVGFTPSRSFVFAPATANLTNSPVSSGKSKRVKILVDRAGDPERVLDVLSTPDGIEAELQTETFGGEYIWYVNVTVPPLTPLGPIRGDVILRTTDEEGNGNAGRLELPVVALVVPDVVASPNLISFRAFDRSVGAEFTGRLAALVPGARLKITGARFEGDHADKLSVEYTPVKAFDDGRALEWTYTVKMAPGHPAGYVAGTAIFELDESIGGLPADQPSNELRVTLSGAARDPAPTKN
jgi:hypothetical protein